MRAMGSLACCLGGIKSHVGIADQGGRGVAVGGRGDAADAGADAHEFADIDIEGAGNGADDPIRQGGCLHSACSRQEYHEFIAAEPADAVAFPNRASEALRDGLQQEVAGGVATDIVDRLEAVEVDVKQTEPARLFSSADRRAQPVEFVVSFFMPFYTAAMIAMMAQNYDITIRMIRAEYLNRQLAMTDVLTGLPNRMFLDDELDRLCAAIGRGEKASGFSLLYICLLYTSPSPRDLSTSRMPSSA